MTDTHDHEYDLPAHVIAQLDQTHAAAEERLNIVLQEAAASGVADFAGPERAIGIALALRDRPADDILEIASHALSRLIAEQQRRCHRCDGTGTVHVTIYGGHDVDCGACRGTGRNNTEGATSGRP